MDSWFLAAIHGSKGNELMVAEDPVRHFCLSKLRNIPAQVFCVSLVLVQAYLINHHLVAGHNGDNLWWLWYLADAVSAIGFLCGFYLREWRISQLRHRRKDSTGFHKGLPFASISWLVYIIFIGIRVVLIFKRDLELHAEIGNIQITICLTAIICIFFTIGHHHRHESLARRAIILQLIKSFTIDLLDTIDILDSLFETEIEHESQFPKVLEDVVLAVMILNLTIPAIVFWNLFMDHYASKSKKLTCKMIKAILELGMINIPLLIIRLYTAVFFSDFISVFLVKNILAILFAIIEIYDCWYHIRQIHKGLEKNEMFPELIDDEDKDYVDEHTSCEKEERKLNSISSEGDDMDMDMDDNSSHNFSMKAEEN